MPLYGIPPLFVSGAGESCRNRNARIQSRTRMPIPKALPAFKGYERRDPVLRDFASFPEGIPLELWHQRKKKVSLLFKLSH
jgi:hypothetical protein